MPVCEKKAAVWVGDLHPKHQAGHRGDMSVIIYRVCTNEDVNFMLWHLDVPLSQSPGTLDGPS